jgi:hypothetical protein
MTENAQDVLKGVVSRGDDPLFDAESHSLSSRVRSVEGFGARDLGVEESPPN